jgi:hypothetical protein
MQLCAPLAVAPLESRCEHLFFHCRRSPLPKESSVVGGNGRDPGQRPLGAFSDAFVWRLI